MALTQGSSLFNVEWVRYVVCAVTHQACRQALLKQSIVVATQRLVGYAKDAYPPYIRIWYRNIAYEAT